MDASENIDVAGRALAVVERDGAHDPATGNALTGSWLWDSAVVLATHLASADPSTLLGATVLELGAGTGLPGIAAVACFGAARCVLTDVRPLLPGLRANAEANGLTPAQADVRELRWGGGRRMTWRCSIVRSRAWTWCSCPNRRERSLS